MADVFTIQSDALPKSTTVVGFRGVEAISRLYQLDVFLLIDSEDPYFEPRDALGKLATLRIEHPKHPHQIHGQVAQLEFIAMLDEHSVFRAVLVPRLWGLTQSLHSRVFTNQSTPEIIEAVLTAAGLTSDDYMLRLTESYAPREHVCQYRESDFDFVSRWMERDGIYYYFQHDDSSEKLVITDDKVCHETRSDTVRFVERHGRDVSADEAISRWTGVHTALPASVSLYDYDYLNPTLVLASTAQVSSGSGELRTHNAGFLTDDAGKRAARIRAEELKAGQVVFRAEGTVSGLCAGMQFSLDEHPRGRFSASYLITALELRGNQLASGRADSSSKHASSKERHQEIVRLTGLDDDDVYSVTLTAIPAAVQFRAKSVTPWPRVYGYESGITAGASESPYAQIDEEGRYKVKLMFDESSLSGEQVSAWLRMLQPHGGDSEGFHFPLRAGVEVAVTFLGGDPDRPVIAGFVPNATHPSPVTQSNRTENVITTGGNNRVVFEDAAGQQSISLQTPVEETSLRLGWPKDDDDHNLALSTTGKMSSHTGKDRDVVIGGKLQRTVAGDATEEFCAALTQTIGSEDDHTAAGVNAAKTLGKTVVTQNVYGNVAQAVEGDVTQSVNGSVKQQVEKQLDQKIMGSVSLEYNAEEPLPENFSFETPGEGESWAFHHQVHGSAFQEATDNWKIKAANTAEMESGAFFLTSQGFHCETILGGHQRIIVGEGVEVVVGGKLDLSLALAFDIALALAVEYKTLSVEVAGVESHLKGTTFKNVGVKIADAGAAIYNAAVSLRQSAVDLPTSEIAVAGSDLLIMQ